jgi:thiamine-phosphate pyrophosphorylase
MLKIAITAPEMRADEARMIVEILDAGWDYVHLRHPDASLRDMRNLIEAIPQRLYRRLKLHGHFDLLNDFNLGGVHLNRRCPTAPASFRGDVSRSCHSLDEVMRYAPECNYVTLSPIFPSISKPGYVGSFTDDELKALPRDKVIALGGITPDKLGALAQYPFVGFAVLGYLWGAVDVDEMRRRLSDFR